MQHALLAVIGSAIRTAFRRFRLFETAKSASQLQRPTFKLPVSFKIFVRYPVVNLVNSKTSTRKRLHHSPINNSSESFQNKISNGFLNAIKGMASQWGTALDRNAGVLLPWNNPKMKKRSFAGVSQSNFSRLFNETVFKRL